MALRFVRWRFALLLWPIFSFAPLSIRAQESSPLVSVCIAPTIAVYRIEPSPDAPHADTIYFCFKRAIYNTTVWRISTWMVPSAAGTLATYSTRFAQVDSTGYPHVAELWLKQLPSFRSRYRAAQWSGMENQAAQTPPRSTDTMLHPPTAVFDRERNPATFETVDK